MENEIVTKSETLAVAIPDAASLAKETAEAKHRADIILILDAEGLASAKAAVDSMKARVKELESMRKSITKPMDDAKKRVMDLFRPTLDQYVHSIEFIRCSIVDYLNDQERKAAEARARAEAKAAAERKALEEKVKAAETREQAEALKQVVTTVVAKPVAKIEKPKGLSTRKEWKATITDKVAFITEALSRPELLDCVDIDLGKLNRLITAGGGKLEAKGMTVEQKTVLMSRA